MRLGRQVHDRIRLKFIQCSADGRAVGNIRLHKTIARMTCNAGQRLEVTGIGQFVEIQYWLVACTQPVENEICADKTGTTCHKYHVDPFLIKL